MRKGVMGILVLALGIVNSKILADNCGGGEKQQTSKNTEVVNQRQLDKLEDEIDLHLQKHDFAKADKLIEKWKKQSAQGSSQTFYELLYKALRGIDQQSVQSELRSMCESDPDNLSYRYYEGIAHLHAGNFKQAEKIFGELKSQPKIKKPFRNLIQEKWENSRNGSIYRSDHNVIIEPNNLINTEEDEYANTMSLNGKRLSYTRFEAVDSLDQSIQKEVIYEAILNSNGQLVKELRLFSNNSQFNYSPLEYSFDNDKLYYFKGETHKTGNIYEAEREGDTWNEMALLKGEVNSSNWDGDITFSYDGKYAVFSSNRPGGYGGRDLYSVNLQNDGSWGELKNLGPSINTEKDEDSPFFRKDDLVLYFSSNGHSGLGGMDIFYCDFQNGNYSYPKNIGYPINTAGDDKYFKVNATGQEGSYSSSIGNNSTGGHDIYTIYNEPTCIDNSPNLTVLDLRIHGDPNEIRHMEIIDENDHIVFKSTLKDLSESNSAILKNGSSYEVRLSGDADSYSEWLDLSDIHALHRTEKNIGFLGSNNVLIVSDSLRSGHSEKQPRQNYILSILNPDNNELETIEFEDIPNLPNSQKGGSVVTVFGEESKSLPVHIEYAENGTLDLSEYNKLLYSSETRIDESGNVNPKVHGLAIEQEQPVFKNFFDFNEVTLHPTYWGKRTFREMIQKIEQIDDNKSAIWIHIKSRASRVPTSRSGGNEKLAYDRGKEFKKILLKYFSNDMDTSKIKFTYDSKVTGPEYSRKRNKNIYRDNQYVSVYIKSYAK